MLGAARALEREKHTGGADVENGLAARPMGSGLAEKPGDRVDLGSARSS